MTAFISPRGFSSFCCFKTSMTSRNKSISTDSSFSTSVSESVKNGKTRIPPIRVTKITQAVMNSNNGRSLKCSPLIAVGKIKMVAKLTVPLTPPKVKISISFIAFLTFLRPC
ncbi:hypothetical protein WZ342_2414 [Enterococcus faecalis]|nr:hypothetical protein WZ342_2414 [Enterococcus faecalis]